MKFPSISQLNEDAFNAANRFPLSLASALLGSMLAVYMTEVDLIAEQLYLLNLLLTLALGIPLFFCIDITVEKHGLGMGKRQLLWLAGGFILLIIYLGFPGQESSTVTRIPYIRYLIYNLIIHLLVAYLPFWKDQDTRAFWYYNKNLFIRLVTGLFYSAVIFTGISLAFGALNILFDTQIQSNTFFQVFILVIGIFNSWFFLSGIPTNLEEEITAQSYPKGLRIFTQFILIPLLLIYLTILYFYGGKIILLWDWPRGIVSYMIIAISVLGIFTNLLLFPIQGQKESGWIKKFYATFYYLLLPLVAILFLAIGIRIGDYGLTVNRYIIVLMGSWLTFISGYFILGYKNIKIIPMSLAFCMLLSSFGPWGMFGMSRRVQVGRLESILSQGGVLKDGKIQHEVQWILAENGVILPKNGKSSNSLGKADLDKVNSIVQYLEDYHGMSAILPWFQQDLKVLLVEAEAKSERYAEPDYSKLIVESMGLEYIPAYRIGYDTPSYRYFSFLSGRNKPLPVSAYDYLIRIPGGAIVGERGDTQIIASVDYSKTGIEIAVNQHTETLDLNAMLDKLLADPGEDHIEEEMDPESMMVESTIAGVRIKVYLEQINCSLEDGERKLTHVQGLLLIKEFQGMD